MCKCSAGAILVLCESVATQKPSFAFARARLHAAMDAASRLALFQNAFQAREASGTRLGWAQESLFGSRPRLEQSIEINMVGLSKWQRTGPSAFATEALHAALCLPLAQARAARRRQSRRQPQRERATDASELSTSAVVDLQAARPGFLRHGEEHRSSPTAAGGWWHEAGVERKSRA